jgi:hypothetical protein
MKEEIFKKILQLDIIVHDTRSRTNVSPDDSLSRSLQTIDIDSGSHFMARFFMLGQVCSSVGLLNISESVQGLVICRRSK